MEVNVVGVEVIRYVRRLPSPGLECLQLMLRLRHVAREVREGAKVLDAVAGIDVNGVEPLVQLYLHEHIFPRCGSHQDSMLLQCLNRWLGDQDVHTAFDASQRYLQMRVIRSENDCTIAGLETFSRRPEGLRVNNAIAWECLYDRGVDALIHVTNHALHVRPDLWQLLAVHAAHAQPAQLATRAQVEADEADNAGRLVRVCRLAADEASRVLTSAHHQAAWRSANRRRSIAVCARLLCGRPILRCHRKCVPRAEEAKR
mmetsp:Transcript_13419/g.37109  ORF Transcript_13419/g.37109 Transcript_13419/m.37109 type:complete len:258 (+) Transcript_13419:774-1547(+)